MKAFHGNNDVYMLNLIWEPEKLDLLTVSWTRNLVYRAAILRKGELPLCSSQNTCSVIAKTNSDPPPTAVIILFSLQYLAGPENAEAWITLWGKTLPKNIISQ